MYVDQNVEYPSNIRFIWLTGIFCSNSFRPISGQAILFDISLFLIALEGKNVVFVATSSQLVVQTREEERAKCQTMLERGHSDQDHVCPKQQKILHFYQSVPNTCWANRVDSDGKKIIGTPQIRMFGCSLHSRLKGAKNTGFQAH